MVRAGDQPRRDQVLEGIGRQGVQGIDLLGHPHGADLGRHGGTDRPATIRPARTGPSSRVIETMTTLGIALSAEKRAKPV